MSTPDVLDSGTAGGKAIRGGAARTGGFIASILFTLVSVPFMIRHLGAVDYGYYITVSSIIFILGGITEAGLTNLAVREISVLDAPDRGPFLRNIIGLRLVLTTAGTVLATGIVALTGAPAIVVQGTAITGLGLLITLMQQTYMVPLTAQLRFGWITALEVLKQGTLSGLTILFVVLGASLLPFFWVTVIAGTVATGATVALLGRSTELRPVFHPHVWRRILRETLPYAVAAAVGLIYFRIAVILMSYVSTATETGYFSAAFRIVEVVAVTPWILVSSSFPILARAARDDEERLGYALQRLFEVSTAAGAWIAVCLAVGAPFAIELIAGPGFEPSVNVLRIQSAGLVTAFLVATWLFAMLSLKLFRQLLYANAAAAVVAVVGTLVLAPPLGAEGAAIATVAAEAVCGLACLFVVQRARPALRPRLGIVPKVVLAVAVSLVPALLIDAHSIVLVVLSSIAFFAVLLPLRGIPPELLNALRGREPERPDEPAAP